MKRKFLDRHSANALLKGRSLLAGTAVLFLALILIVLRLTAPGFLITITSPIVRAGSGLASVTHTFFETFGNKIALVGERDALQVQVDTLTANERALEGQLRDMERLLGGRHTATPGILASVLMRPPVSPYDTLVIDVGSADGVVQGSLVSGVGGIPLGVIDTLTEKTARVTLFSTPGKETEAWVGSNRIAITLTGTGAGAYLATISKEAKIVEGDVVTIPGSMSSPIGKVLTISSNPSSPLVEIFVSPFTNPFELTWVQVAPRAL